MTTINNSNYDPYYLQRMQGNPSSPSTTVGTSATAPTSSSQGTTFRNVSKDPHIPTPVYPDSSVIIPSNGDGTVTIKTPDGREVKFEYPSWEEFFKEEVLADFIQKAQNRSYGLYRDYRDLNEAAFGAPIAFVSADANSDIVISDDTVKDLCAYIDYLIEKDLLNVDETKEKSQGYNKYLTLLNISEDEAHYMSPKLAKEKLNEFYKNIGNGEKDANGNYKVPADMYYTYIAENYFDPNYFMNPLESNNLIFMQSATDLGRMYIEYCADKFYYAMDKNFTESQGAYAHSSLLYGKIDDAYAAVQGGHYNTRPLNDFPAVVSFLEKDDENGQKLAQMICKAAGVNEDDSDAIKRNKLLNFGKKFIAAKTDSTTSRKFDKMILIAYLNTQGYNDPALYPEKPQTEVVTGSFDYSGISRINDKILTSFNDYEDYEVLYKEVLKLCPQMQEYIKSAINQIGGTYDKNNVQYYLNNFITQAIEAATNPSAKVQGARPETLKDVFEYVKQLIDEELAQSDAYSMTASNLKELLTGTHKNTLDWRDRELKDFISMLDVPQDKKLPSYFEGYSYAYKPNDAVCEIETYSQYQKLELKELYPQLSDEQIQQILEGKDDYIKEQYAKYKAEGIHSAELFHKLLHDYRNACLAEAKSLAGVDTQEPPIDKPSGDEPPVTEPPIDEPSGEEPSVTEPPTDEPSVEEPPVTEPEPEIPSWQVPMVNAAKEKGYQATDITGKYTYTDESGTSYVCIWDPIGQNFMNFVTATPQPETEPEFTEDDKTIEPTVDGFYGEALIAASKEEYQLTDDFGIFEKDGKQYEYDTEKEEFIEYNPLESYYSQFDENGFAIKKTLRNIYVESLRRAAELGYSPTDRIGIFEKDGKQYKYDADAHKFVEIKSKTPEPQPEPESEEE